MSKPSDSRARSRALREKIIGLGERSIRKSYYSALQAHVAELERFRSLLDQTTDAIFLFQAPDGKLVDVNESACNRLNRSRNELLTMTVDSLWPGPVAERVKQLFRASQPEATPPTERLEMVTGPEERFPAEVTFRLVRFNDSDYVVAVARDLSQRILAEQALREREKKYRTLVESSPLGIALYDLNGNIVELNSALPKMMCSPSLEATRAVNLFTFPLLVRAGLSDAMMECVKSGEHIVGEYPYTTKWGKSLHIRLHVSPVRDREERVVGGLVFCEDISENKRLEEQIRQAAKMEAIGRLAGGVAHDFNNLITAMLGYATLILQQLPQNSQIRDKVEQITGAAKRAASLTRQLLAFSRKQMLDVRPLNLNTSIREFEPILRRLIGEDISLVVHLEPSLRHVLADPGQMEQILMNLAANARDSMPEGGTLTIGTQNVELDPSLLEDKRDLSPGSYVSLSVSDTGAGMDAHTLAHIFEPFFTTKAKGTGTGLGMATVYGVVKQHRGHISVWSELDYGTTFTVHFPVVDEPTEKIFADATARRHARGTATVLVVEDEEIVRNLACEALETLGYSTLNAADPEEAIRICKRHNGVIDLVLSDVVLPQMDGKSLFAVLSRIRPQMKVLYVSGYTESFIVRHGVLDRDVHFLQKPFTVDKLAAKVNEVLKSNPGTL